MALALVQSAGASSTTSATASFGAATTAGNTIVVVYGIQKAGGISGFAWGGDIAVGPLVGRSADSGDGTYRAGIWATAAAGGEHTVNLAFTSGSGVIQLEIMEFSGLGTAPLEDTFTPGTATTGTSFPSMSSGTLHGSNEIVVGSVFANGSVSSEAWTNSFNSVSHSTNQLLASYILPGTTTAQSTVASWTTSHGAVGLMVAIKGSPATITKTLTAQWNVAGTITKTLTALWNVAATITKTLTALWKVQGPLPPGWYITTEVAWTTDPLTRPSPGDWTVLTEGIKSLTAKRGTKILSTGIETGTATAVLQNEARRLDPDYTLSPYAPNVIPRRRIRFVLRDSSGTLLKVLHTGFIERYQRSWSLDVAQVTLPTQDLFGVISSVNLPISVLDYVTRGLNPVNYWPLGEASGATTFTDEVGSADGTFRFPLQSSGIVTNYDPRQGPACGPDQSATQQGQYALVTPYTAPAAVTMAVWFRTQPQADATIQMPLMMLQEGSTPVAPGSVSGSSYFAFLELSHTSGDADYARIAFGVSTHSNFCIDSSLVAQHLLDGGPHLAVAALDGAARTLKLWVDGVNQAPLVDPGSSGVSISSVNCAAALSNSNLCWIGYGIGTSARAANVNQASIYNRILTDAEVLELWNAGSAPWAGDRTDQRADKVCDLMGIDPADRNFDVGTQTCGPTVLNSQNGLAYIKKIVATEQGSCFVNGDKIRFTARPSGGSPIQVFSDDPLGDNGVPAEPWQPDYGWDRIVNTLEATIETGESRIVQDATSVATFGPLTGSVGGKLDTLHETIDDAAATAQWIIDGHKNPTSYVPDVKVSSVDKSVSQDALLNVEVADLVAVVGRPPSPTVEALGIEAQVEHVQIDVADLEITVTYSPGDGTPYP